MTEEMETDLFDEREEAEEESVETHYQGLVHSLWAKGLQLVFKEEEDQAQSQQIASQAELESFYARMTAIQEQLNVVKSKVHKLVNNNNGDELDDISSPCGSQKNVSCLDRWRSFTMFTHPLRQLPRRLMAKCAENGLASTPQLFTQAYCKFVQIAAAHPALIEIPCSTNSDNGKQVLRSLHLCEAPGAFVLALKHCLAKRGIGLDWYMNSLNPHRQCNGESLKNKNLALEINDLWIREDNQARMLYGRDGVGDIFNWDQQYIAKICANGKFSLVTADGGIDCTDDPREQESRTRPLIERQFKIASECLCLGGTLLLKAYTCFEAPTIRLFSDICATFSEVHCLKPPSSKPSNSEVYLLCFGFRGIVPPAKDFTRQFLKRMEQCARLFAGHQMRFMEFNLRTFRRMSQSERTKLEVQKCAAQGIMTEFLWQQIQCGLCLELQEHKIGDGEE